MEEKEKYGLPSSEENILRGRTSIFFNVFI